MGVQWAVLRAQRPDLAEVGRALLYQFGVGLAFVSTVRPDGGPRLHPVCPLVTDAGLFMFVTPSLKRDDLHRDARFALHSYPCADNEDAFYVTGQAVLLADDTEQRTQFLVERNWGTAPPPGWAEQEVFELLIERCLYTKTVGHGDFEPRHTVWRAMV